MAAIRKRGDKWQVQVRRSGFAGQSKSFHNQKDAERWATLKERELDVLESQGLTGAKACDLSVAGLLLQYQQSELPRKRGASREAYMVQAMARSSFAAARADRLSAREVARYRDQRLTTVAPATVVRELGLLQHAFEIARRSWGYEGLNNPLKDVQRPKLPSGRTRRLAPDEEAALIAAAEGSYNRLLVPMMLFALETSMRLGEIVAARWSHLDKANRVLLLPQTKNGKPRTIPLSQAAMLVLAGLPTDPGGFIFPTTVEAIKRAWIRLTRRAKIADLRFHDLRHEAISRLVERGFDLPSVMMFSGHSDHRMLLRYTHLNARSLVTRLDSFDEDRKLLATPCIE